MKHYYLILCITINCIVTINGMHNQALFISLPDFVLHKILKHLSTEQILRFRQVTKQAQKVAETFLINNYGKQVIINHASGISPALIKKLSGITLQFDQKEDDLFIPIALTQEILDTDLLFYNQENNVFVDIVKPLINQVSHLKALHLHLFRYVNSIERASLKKFFTQLQQLEVLKVQQSPLAELSSVPDNNYDDYHVADILKALPLFASLKKLHVNTQVQAVWVLLTQHLPNLKKLEVLHIEGSPPCNIGQLLTFTKALQNLTILKKLCLYNTTIDEEGADALGRSLSTLKNLRVLNLSKSIMTYKNVEKFKELLSALQNNTSHGLITFYPTQHPLIEFYQRVYRSAIYYAHN